MLGKTRERAAKTRWLRWILAFGNWHTCKICGTGFNYETEVASRPLEPGLSEIVCYWCGQEGREGAVPFYLSWMGDVGWAAPAEFWDGPMLMPDIKEIIKKHNRWREENKEYIEGKKS